MSEIYLARQPIFDSKFNLHGYELLFRNGLTDHAELGGAEAATSKVLLSSLIDIGIDKVTAGNDCYINIDQNYINDIDDFVGIPLGTASLTLEFEIDAVYFEEHKEALTRLSSDGIKLALDHFVPDASLEHALKLFDVVKCDTKKLTHEQLIEASNLAKKYKCKIVATNIESYKKFPDLYKAGVDYFQGFFLSKPDISVKKTVPTILLPVIKTLSRILDPNLELEELEELIMSDVSLSFRVLKLINSARYNVDDIDSISRAIVYLGREAIKNLTIIIILTGVDDKPTELAKLALIRAKMCEIISKKGNIGQAGTCFTVGLLSVLGAMLDQTMEQVLENLQINNELKAILQREGEMGMLLQCVIDYEEFQLDKVTSCDVNSSELTGYYLESVDWAEQTFKGLSL